MPGSMWRDMADRFSRHGGLSQTTFLERQFEGVCMRRPCKHILLAVDQSLLALRYSRARPKMGFPSMPPIWWNGYHDHLPTCLDERWRVAASLFFKLNIKKKHTL
jgi:hypothetical protein